MALRVEELSYAIIGKAMEVHRELGPGVDERFYHELLCERLRATGIEHLSKPREALIHRGHTADIFEPDLVFPKALVTELKWLWGGFAAEHFVQLKCYLKFWRIADGLLLDFGKESLVQRRYVFEERPAPPLNLPEFLAETPPGVGRELATRIGQAVVAIATGYGLGYRDSTYRGLLAAELTAEGVGNTDCPSAAIHSGTRPLGESRLPCLVVEKSAALMVLALREGIRAADRAILQSWLQHLKLPWGLIAHFGAREVQLQWVTPGRKSSE
ncbi:MAG: GxxExxY protein [Verrucomicrobia bacterium]|nr:GxxExxY protein [Verrucomicrobiota bacterium]